MFVDPARLRSGAADTRGASEHAHAGASRLNQTSVAAGIFGGFGAADVFHNALCAGPAEHITTHTGTHRTLDGAGVKSHRAALVFAGMDQRYAAQLRAVRCNSDT